MIETSLCKTGGLQSDSVFDILLYFGIHFWYIHQSKYYVNKTQKHNVIEELLYCLIKQ